MEKTDSIMVLTQSIDQFRDERNWRQFHNEKDLAISLSLEASEFLELFQWQDSSEVKAAKMPQIKEELADVVIYALMLASNLKLDVGQIVLSKLAQNVAKYPVAKSLGSRKKYNEL